MAQEDKSLTAFQKVNDWYSKHNFGTRVALFTFLGMYILAVGTSVDYSVFSAVDVNTTVVETVKETSTNIKLVELVGYFAFGAMALVTLGDNALTKIGDIIVKVKGGKKDNS